MLTLSPLRRGTPARAAAAVLLTAGLATAALALTATRLTVGGQTVSTDVRMIGGRPYVPLADMARAMNGTAVRHGAGSYEIQRNGVGGTDSTTPVPAGGANEVQGTGGKIGQVVFTGGWRFTVLGVDRAKTYDSRFLPDARKFEPSGDTQELVIVRCRLKNAHRETAWAMMSPIHPHNTAVTDDQEQSYSPLGFDKRGGHLDEGPNMLPGSQTEFAVVFSVPKETVLKDLVYSLQLGYDDTPKGCTDLRITLTP